MNPTQMREGVEWIDACLRELHQDPDGNLRTLTPDEQTRFDEGLAERERLAAELARHDRVARLAAIPGHTEDSNGGLQFQRKVEVPGFAQVRGLAPAARRDAALKRLDVEKEVATDTEREAVEALLRKPRSRNYDPDIVAARLLITESEEYRSAFAKAYGANGAVPGWELDEARAMHEFRAMSQGTDSAGGYGLPVLIDPTIILTSGAVDAPVLTVCRIEAITTDEWKGVSAQAVAWSTDAEASAVSDDSPTLAQPVVTTYRGAAFVPYSIEVGMNYPGFAGEMSELIREGYVNYLATKTSSGSGSDIQGIFTALDANTNVEVTPTTDGAFGAVDIDKVWKELKKRWRVNARWLMNVDVENEIRAFGSGTATSRFTVDQTREGISLLNGKAVLIDEFAPEFTGTTGASNILILGDFRNYLFVRRLGMTVEFVPHVFDVTDNRPTGQRGWYAYAFSGGDSINDLGFRLLQNQ